MPSSFSKFKKDLKISVWDTMFDREATQGQEKRLPALRGENNKRRGVEK